jgi:lysophospholipase L1-like esterase
MIGQFFIPFSFLFLSISSCGQGALQTTVAQAVETKAPLGDTLPKRVRNYTRFEKEILRFEESDRASAPRQGSILFVGSSTIRLWKTLAEDMAPLPVINRGFGGGTIGEVNYYFHRIVDKYKPRLVVFYAGENDLYSPDISVDSVVRDFNAFRDSMHAYLPNCKAIFVSVKPSPARWKFQDKFMEANKRFEAICKYDPAWSYVDVIPSMLDAGARPRKEIYRADSLHMNAAGYARWTKIIRPHLK